MSLWVHVCVCMCCVCECVCMVSLPLLTKMHGTSGSYEQIILTHDLLVFLFSFLSGLNLLLSHSYFPLSCYPWNLTSIALLLKLYSISGFEKTPKVTWFPNSSLSLQQIKSGGIYSSYLPSLGLPTALNCHPALPLELSFLWASVMPRNPDSPTSSSATPLLFTTFHPIAS